MLGEFAYETQLNQVTESDHILIKLFVSQFMSPKWRHVHARSRIAWRLPVVVAEEPTTDIPRGHAYQA